MVKRLTKKFCKSMADLYWAVSGTFIDEFGEGASEHLYNIGTELLDTCEGKLSKGEIMGLEERVVAISENLEYWRPTKMGRYKKFRGFRGKLRRLMT